jgi:putative flippase GtrA
LFTRLNPLFDYARLLRFGLVGLLNTALGYSVILAALWLGYGDVLSNLTGYAAGLIVGFVLNSRWTFGKSTDFRLAVVARYAGAFLIAYGVNLGVVLAARSTQVVDGPVAHLAGICAYTILFYLGSVYFVFPKDAPISPRNWHATNPQSEPR